MSSSSSGDSRHGRDDFVLGELAIRDSLCTFEQVKECLDAQAQLRAMGIVPRRLGDLLVEKGYLTRAQVDALLLLQGASGSRASRLSIPGYEIAAKIGQGAMGSVYRARQISMDRIVAIKVLSSKHARDAVFVDRFVKEARAVARLNHENIISGIDVGEAGGVHYFVMEHVDGTTVARILKGQGRIDEKRCLHIGAQIARALDHAHKSGMVHRDVKPENIMITSDGIAKLCDLGLAKQVTGDNSLTVDGTTLGTPNYISPEQARAETNLDIRTDIYSLGATLYHMSTGRPPFIGPNPMSVMTKHVTDRVEPPKKHMPTLSDGFSAMIEKMMQKHREDRYQGPAELLADLEKLHRGEPLGAARTSSTRTATVPRPMTAHSRTARRMLRVSRTSPAGLIAAIGVGVLILIIVLVTLASGSSSRRGTDPNGSRVDAANLEAHHQDRSLLWSEERGRFRAGGGDKKPAELFALLEDNLARFRGSKHEAYWKAEQAAFVSEANRESMRIWDPVRARAQKLREGGRLSDALLEAERLESSWTLFRPGGEGVGQDLLTEAGTLQQGFVAAIAKEIEIRWSQDEARLKSAALDEAMRICVSMAAYAGPPHAVKVRDLRSGAITRCLERLLAPEASAEAIRAAEESLAGVRPSLAADPEAIGVVDTALAMLRKRQKVALQTLVREWETSYRSDVRPNVLKSLSDRDLPGGRRFLQAWMTSGRWDSALAIVLPDPTDRESVLAYLKASNSGDAARMLRPIESVLRAATGPEGTIVRELALDLRELALLDVLLEQALLGAAGLGVAGPGARAGMSKILLEAAGLSPAARPEVLSDYRLKTGNPGSAVHLSPKGRVEDTATEEDLIRLAALAPGAGRESGGQALAAAFLWFRSGQFGRAKAEFRSVPRYQSFALESYWTALEGVTTPDEEKTAEEMYRRAMTLYVEPRQDIEARALFLKLLDQYGGTRFMKERPPAGDRIRLEVARELSGRGGERTVEKLFLGRVRPASDRDRWTVSYDFSQTGPALDFEEHDAGLGGEGRWGPGEGGLVGKGSGLLYWKAQVTGDIDIEWTVKAGDRRNIGFPFAAAGTVSSGAGYVAWLSFETISGREPGRIPGWPRNPLMVLPWHRDRMRDGNFGEEKNSGWELKSGGRHGVRIRRQGKAVDLFVDGRLVTAGSIPDAGVDTGRIGIALWNSQVTAFSARFTVQFDPAWLESALKAGK